MNKVCVDDTTIALSIKNLNRYLQDRATGTSRSRALSDLGVTREGVTQLQTLVYRLAGEVAEMGEQLATARQIATALMKDLEDVTDKLQGNNDCPQPGNGGAHSESYGDDGDGVCEWCGARPILMLQPSEGIAPKNFLNGFSGENVTIDATRGGVIDFGTGEVRLGEPLADVVNRMQEELAQPGDTIPSTEIDPNGGGSPVPEEEARGIIAALREKEQAYFMKAGFDSGERLKDGEAWRIVNKIFRTDKVVYQKLLDKAFKEGMSTGHRTLINVVKKYGDPRKW